jgi:hypothetical protein
MGGCQQQQQQLLDFASGDSGCFIVIIVGAAIAMTDVMLRRRRRPRVVVASTGNNDNHIADADADVLARRASVVDILTAFIFLYPFDLCPLSLEREELRCAHYHTILISWSRP